MQLERQAQHTEGLKALTDVQAQAHEIKHAQNNQDMRIVAIDEKIASHQRFTEGSVARLEATIHENRDHTAAQFTALIARIDDLSAWRHWIMGGMALIGVALVVWGGHIWEGIMHVLPGVKK